MPTLDQWITQLGGGPWTVLLVAGLLGLRHATDPDHITAVSTLLLDRSNLGARRARLLGTAWGLGHGITLFLLGLPLLLFRHQLPDSVHRGAEVAIGAIIVLLAVRLLFRWWRGYFHVHTHVHDGVPHAHPHQHEHPRKASHPEVHRHRHTESIGRTPLAAFGIGLIHGIGGSAGAGLLLVSAAPSAIAGFLALLLFAAGTAVSMTAITWALGALLGRSSVVHRWKWIIPTLGLVSLCFGVWYSLNGLKFMPD